MLLKKVCSLVVSVAFFANPQFAAYAQSPDFSQLPTNGWDSSRISQAVLNNVNETMRNYGLRKHAGQLTASDVDMAAISMKTTLDYFQEIGYLDILEKKLLDNEQAFLDYHPNDEFIQSFQKKLAEQGIQVDPSRIRSTFDPDYGVRQQFLTTVRSQGLYKTGLKSVELFRSHELQIVSQLAGAAKLSVHSRQITAHVIPAMGGLLGMSDIYWACVGAAVIGIASGCTVTAFACQAAVLACTLCATSC